MTEKEKKLRRSGEGDGIPCSGFCMVVTGQKKKKLKLLMQAPPDSYAVRC